MLAPLVLDRHLHGVAVAGPVGDADLAGSAPDWAEAAVADSFDKRLHAHLEFLPMYTCQTERCTHAGVKAHCTIIFLCAVCGFCL